MVFKKLIVFFAVTLIFLGCSNHDQVTIDSINAAEVLEINPDADIFQLNGIIYETNIDWVDQLTLTKDAQMGKILINNETNTNFKDGTANKLPVGTIIFSVKERDDIVIVEVNGELKKYLAIVEG